MNEQFNLENFPRSKKIWAIILMWEACQAKIKRFLHTMDSLTSDVNETDINVNFVLLEIIEKSNASILDYTLNIPNPVKNMFCSPHFRIIKCPPVCRPRSKESWPGANLTVNWSFSRNIRKLHLANISRIQFRPPVNFLKTKSNRILKGG